MRSFALAHPFITLFLGLFTLGLVSAFWPVFLTLSLVSALGYGLHTYTVRYDKQALARARHRHLLAAHADFEHHMLMTGHPAGIYGQYPPAC